MLFANNANTTLASSLTNVATTMSVTSASAFPSPTGSQYFYCTLADAATQTTIEIVKVTAVSGTTFTIVRGQDGTSGTIFASGAVVSLRLVRASLNDFPKLDETNTFTADQAITGQLTTSAGLATTSTFTATPPADGLVMDYATGYGRFSAFAGDGFQWYNAGVANTKLMQLSSTGVITTAIWNGATVGVPYGGTGLTTLATGLIPYGNGTGAFSSNSGFTFDGTNLLITATSAWTPPNSVTARIFSVYGLAVGNSTTSAAYINDRIVFNNATYYVLGSSTGGGVKLDNGTTAWAAQSDETTKDIIEPISSAIDKVTSLRAVIGKYKEDTDTTRRSFLIAQDVQKVLPEAVGRSSDGFLSLRYTEVIPLLVAAIKEQQIMIDDLKSKIGIQQ